MRLAALVIAPTVVMNVIFFVVAYSAAGQPEVAAERTRTAFRTGELTTNDFPEFDTRRGVNQYNDCDVLQMVANRGASRLERTLAPTVFADTSWTNQCVALRAVVGGTMSPDTMDVLKYSRYWHGYNVPTAFALRGMELGTMRRALAAAVWLGIVVLALATYFGGRYTRATGLAIALSAATVWAVPYFAPSITHGVGDAAMLFWLAGLALWGRRDRSAGAVAIFAGAFGASVVFFEVMLGHLPTAAAWLAAVTLAIARDRGRSLAAIDRTSRGEAPLESPAMLAVIATAAFGLGGLLSIAIKQALASILVDSSAVSNFSGKLDYYMQVPPAGRLPGILMPFLGLWQQTEMLTYGHRVAGRVVAGGAVLLWIAGSVLALGMALRPANRDGGVADGGRHAARDASRDGLVLLAAALIPAAWTLLLPTHTAIHAMFLVRMLIVPISLAPLAVWWCVWSARGAALPQATDARP